MEYSKYLVNAQIVREKIDHMLPAEGPIEFDKLNYNMQMLINCPKAISYGIPLSMSAAIAAFQMANFASQFQLKLKLGNSKIPTNAIVFVLSGSGNGKDAAIGAMEKAMDFGYNIIQQEREKKARKAAEARAEQEDGDNSNWQKFYKEPQPLFNAISTVEGLTSRLNQFARDGIGMPSVVVSELGSELQTNPNMTDNIRLISEVYDEGNKKSKAIKDSERQDAEVAGMGMNALFVGSEDNIIMDKDVSKKFRTEFVTKLARRSMFVYPSKEEFDNCIIGYSDYESIIKHHEEMEWLAKEGAGYISSRTADIATMFIERDSRLLDISDEALAAFRDYKLYTTNLGSGMSYIYKSVQLEQTHRSWKMLKLAGVFAIWDVSDAVEIKHVKEAIYFVEKIGKYMEQYEEYASKEEYELILDFFRHKPDIVLSLHDLKKRGFITGNSNIDNKVKELVRMADSLAGSEGTVVYKGDTVSYQPFERVGEHHASYIQVSGSKEERAAKCHSGYENKATTFKNLARLLENDTAYSPFKFMDGKRSNDNIISGTSWVALDVDDSDIDIYEMHNMLGDFNHHIATTSNPDNPYKFRIILEFNNLVDLPVREWKKFGEMLGQELGIKVDPATFTKSQIMFGYKGAKVLSEIDAEPYDVSNAVKQAKLKVDEAYKRKPQLTKSKMRSMLDDPLTTFSYAFNDQVPARSLALYRLWKHVFDLGGSKEEAARLMHDLNYNFWTNPISDERFESYINQMERAWDEKVN